MPSTDKSATNQANGTLVLGKASGSIRDRSTSWKYTPPTQHNIRIRSIPDFRGSVNDCSLSPGEEFLVAEEMKDESVGVLYLRLADGRGWLFDQLPGVGPMCVRSPDKVQKRTGDSVSKTEAFASHRSRSVTADFRAPPGLTKDMAKPQKRDSGIQDQIDRMKAAGVWREGQNKSCLSEQKVSAEEEKEEQEEEEGFGHSLAAGGDERIIVSEDYRHVPAGLSSTEWLNVEVDIMGLEDKPLLTLEQDSSLRKLLDILPKQRRTTDRPIAILDSVVSAPEGRGLSIMTGDQRLKLEGLQRRLLPS